MMQQIFIKAKELSKINSLKKKKSQVVSIKQAWTKKKSAIFKTIPKNSHSEGSNIIVYRQQREWDK